ncbi:MAG: hypothetical protein M0Z50_11165 [Planctomycetia bacterium]|jgi:hypothetical protein|nr:hypothetical protein [Planctomycetia bacterium]
MADYVTPMNVSVPVSGTIWRWLALASVGVSGITFLGGAAALFFEIPTPLHAMPLYIPVLGILAAVSGGVGIFALNAYAAFRAGRISTALWTNLLGRLLALIQLLSLVVVLSFLIVRYIGLPAHL